MNEINAIQLVDDVRNLTGADLPINVATDVARTLVGNFASPDGRNVLEVRGKDAVYHFDLFKAIAAATGIIAAGLGIATASGSLAEAAACASAVSAIAQSRGFETRLSRSAAALCFVLIDKKLRRRDEALNAFVAYLQENSLRIVADDEFDNAVAELVNLGCLSERDDNIILRDRVIVRM